MPLQHREIARPDLFFRLAEGHKSRVTVVTPNRRLAQALLREFDRLHAGRVPFWETADILPLGAFVERLWDDALHSELGAGMPLLATPAQEQALWEEAIAAAGHELFSVGAAAAQCRDAWRLAHGWRLASCLAREAASDDARAFTQWSLHYERLAREKGLTDPARVSDELAPWLAHASVRKPALLVLYGFDLLTPQQQAFFEALAALSVELAQARRPSRGGSVTRLEFASAQDELAAAARWARTRLERDPAARIGIVVPDLAQSRQRVRRALARVLQPGYLLADQAAAVLPFDISLGAPLDQVPLAHAALALLRLCGPRVAFEEASRVLRSPFLAGAESESAVRARLDAALRKRAMDEVTLDGLVRLVTAPSVPRASVLVERLGRLAEHRKPALFGRKSAADWARAFSQALRVAGFPGERTLDSGEQQALEKWHEVLAAFAALERVVRPMGFEAALSRLARLVRDTVFQPESPEVPVEVLGILESAQLEFDHLWVLGLTDEAWPLPARPNPFVPLPMQRKAGIPQADPATSLELDRRITEGWSQAAPEVVMSHARMKADSELAASPLIAPWPLASPEAMEIPAYSTLREALHSAGGRETLADARAPALAADAHGGGTGLFKDQAACPFRAFARRRLHSEALEIPQPGLDPRERGTLLHELMHKVWSRLRDRATLEAATPSALEELLAACAEEVVSGLRRYRHDPHCARLAALERARLVRAARALLEIELRRPDFEVVALEEKRSVTFGGLTIQAKLDRMDRLAAGGHAVLDYKAKAGTIGSWLGPRPDEPQLPMYALAVEDVRAIAFVGLAPGEVAFCGLAKEKDLLPRVGTIEKNTSHNARRYRDWDALLAGWRVELDALGAGFRSGDARVAPKRKQACAQCEQQALCRIAEKAPYPAAEPGGEPSE